MDRRKFISTFLVGVPALSLIGKPIDLPHSFMRSLKNDSLDLRYLMGRLGSSDLVDHAPDYLKSWSDYQGDWVRRAKYLIQNRLAHYQLPATGRIVELGTYRGDSLHLMGQIWGHENCLGVDLVKYAERSNIIQSDVRHLVHTWNEPVRMVWSNTSTWKKAPKSKMASKMFADKFLVKGGILVEDTLKNVPSLVSYRKYELLDDDGDFAIFRKIG